MTGTRSLSIVIPAYCEADNILGTLSNVTTAVASLPLDVEIIVVDDGSTDGTSDVVKANADRFPGVRLLVNERNMGFGWTYRRGVAAATRDYIVMVHGDNAWGAGKDKLITFFRGSDQTSARVGEIGRASCRERV